MGKTKISIFGATGSIGGFTLDLISRLDEFKRPEILLISGFSQIEKLTYLAEKFKVKYIFTPQKAKDLVFTFLKDKSYKFVILSTFEELYQLYDSEDKSENFIINGIIGENGIIPTFLSQHFNIYCGCANKESIIISHEFFNDFKRDLIFPLDSEHNGIYSLLKICPKERISKIYITASGGKVYDKTEKELEDLQTDEFTKHPNWNMGKRITIDSSSGINKAFEFIEAQALFDIPKDMIEILIDRKSQVHSIIRDINNYYYAAISNPDMCLPINMFLKSIGLDIPYSTKPIKNDAFSFELISNIYKTYPFLNIFIHSYDKSLLAGTILIHINSYLQDLFFENKINFVELRKLLIESYSSLFIKDTDEFKKNYTNDTDKNTLKKFSFLNKDSYFDFVKISDLIFNKAINFLRNKKILGDKW